MQIKIYRSIVLASVCYLSACAAPDDSPLITQEIVNPAVEQLGCEGFRDSLFEGVQIYLMSQERIPTVAGLEKSVRETLHERYDGKIPADKLEDLIVSMTDFYKFLTIEVAQTTQTVDLPGLKRILGALKIGDHTTPVAEALQQSIDAKLAVLQEIILGQGLTCSEVSKIEDFVPSPDQSQALNANVPLPVWGIRKAMATAYQSCESLRLPPMSRSVQRVEGIKDIGAHPLGGRLRKIVDQSAVARTHYYIKEFRGPASCIDVKKTSMIYDFGGKPSPSASSPELLNFWKNSPGSSPGLGVDCSGYVFSALSVSGMRLREGKKIKPIEADSVSAAMMKNPKGNGLSCLSKAKFGKTMDLQAGDIAAAAGHVVMIERVGKDPFAIRKYRDCNQITHKDLDFVVAQSSPEQNAIGINKYDVREYLANKSTTNEMHGLVDYARGACKAFQAGKDLEISTSRMAIVRHKQTSECLQTELKLEAQSCIQDCAELLE